MEQNTEEKINRKSKNVVNAFQKQQQNGYKTVRFDIPLKSKYMCAPPKDSAFHEFHPNPCTAAERNRTCR